MLACTGASENKMKVSLFLLELTQQLPSKCYYEVFSLISEISESFSLG
jgi:hypothetical protein